MNAIETKGKRSVNIDFAPMVDLGFLLITFFIFTTELSKPKAFGLHVPDDSKVIPDPPQTPHSATITLLMKENGSIDYFEGRKESPLQTGSTHLYQQTALRKMLINKRSRIIQQLNTDSNYTVIIHPSAATSYKEMIDILDEMKINDIRKYVLMDTEIAKQ
ncbi:MAG: biopolymer transporter ExbD [Chitinophagaceae bacterium]|nr:biopolymer transporter ExbD [Chitinophagaceae bacterium]